MLGSVNCEGCGKELELRRPRIEVKGASWIFKELGREPAYKLFSFCPNLQCLHQGTYLMKDRGDLFPEFSNEIGTALPAEMCGQYFEELKRQHAVLKQTRMVEGYYTLDSPSQLVANVVQ